MADFLARPALALETLASVPALGVDYGTDGGNVSVWEAALTQEGCISLSTIGLALPLTFAL